MLFSPAVAHFHLWVPSAFKRLSAGLFWKKEHQLQIIHPSSLQPTHLSKRNCTHKAPASIYKIVHK